MSQKEKWSATTTPNVGPTTRVSKRKTPFEVAQNKRRLDLERGKTRVNIGAAFPRWRQLRESKRLKTDAMLAIFLLDCYQEKTSRQNRCKDLPDRADQMEQDQGSSRGSSPILSYAEVQVEIEEEEEGNQKKEREVLSSSENEEAAADSGRDDSSDEDYMTPIYIRAGAALQPKIKLEDDDQDYKNPDANDAAPLPEQVAVNLPGDIIGEQVSMVYHKCVQQLVQFLPLPVLLCTEKDPLTSEKCGAFGPFMVNISSRGTAMIVKWCCPNGHVVWQWNSQPTFKYGMQAGDFMLSSNIFLSGNNFAKVALLFRYMNMGMVSRNTFFVVQNAYCVDTVKEYCLEKKPTLISEAEGGGVVVQGNGKMDSPGSCTRTSVDSDTREMLSENIDTRKPRGSSKTRTGEALSDKVQLAEVSSGASSQISAADEARRLLAALDQNHNSHRAVKRSADGSTLKVFDRRSQSRRLYSEKVAKDYSYIPELQTVIVSKRLMSNKGLPRCCKQRTDDPTRRVSLSGLPAQ